VFNIVLFEPEIPPNTGNIIRLCANTGCQLHLIEPLGFSMTDKQLRRAGLDYHEFTDIINYPDLEACFKALEGKRVFALSTRGTARYSNIKFVPGDILLFGPETRGLPQSVLDSLPKQNVLRIPMRADNRSLNLSNAAAIVVYEGLRQQNFPNET